MFPIVYGMIRLKAMISSDKNMPVVTIEKSTEEGGWLLEALLLWVTTVATAWVQPGAPEVIAVTIPRNYPYPDSGCQEHPRDEEMNRPSGGQAGKWGKLEDIEGDPDRQKVVDGGECNGKYPRSNKNEQHIIETTAHNPDTSPGDLEHAQAESRGVSESPELQKQVL
ncbi:hypothetical protein OG21DRAFT_1527008 [Imleria badia]|nr:hypothetical protein OG21DRAFT_1527008 [Imleria badia]